VFIAAALLVSGCTSTSIQGRARPPVPSGPDGSPHPDGSPSTGGRSPSADDLLAGRSDPVAEPLYPARGNPDLDILHYDLKLAWEPGSATLTGTATLSVRPVRPVSALSLDFAGSYAIDATSVNGAVAPGRITAGDKLAVTLSAALPADTPATLVVRYHGRPHPVRAPTTRSDATEGLGLRATAAGEVWTMQEPYGAFTWYPVNDIPSDKARYDIAATVPAGWSAVASGEFTGSASGPEGTTFTWHGSDPQASYLTTLAIGHYTRTDLTGPHGLPITLWTRTGVDEPLLPALRDTPRLIEWLEQHFGRYPFRAAGVVVVASVSAMETQEMVTLGADIGRTGGPSRMLLDEVVLHELSHQWFGDAVTPRDWRGLWLNEGWATWAQIRWEIDEGQMTPVRWRETSLAVDGKLRRDLGPPGAPQTDRFAEDNVYLCPELMLEAIHDRVGDAVFLTLARDWVAGHQGGTVDRAAFTAFVNQHTGQDLTKLIDAWLDSPTTPPASLGGK
jgi:aminopeptidase N